MSLANLYQSAGAQLAPDGIPLHFGDLKAEYAAVDGGAVVFDRSHEGRIALRGADRFDLLNRISTNHMLNMKPDEGRPTIFTNANARIIDRVVAYHQSDDRLLLLAGPGRNSAVSAYLKRNIFYGDDVQIHDLLPETHHFALHGDTATAILAQFVTAISDEADYRGFSGQIAGADVYIARLKPFVGAAWSIITPKASAGDVWSALRSAGAISSGGIVYNALRIRAGQPGVGFELSDQYIPLELGLWDEVSFNKGCYTGQEIIARMESRKRLAKMLVRLHPAAMIPHGTPLFHGGKRAGEVTSSVTAPDGAVWAMGVIKTSIDPAEGDELRAVSADGVRVTVGGILGVQPLHS